jgi:hypothetical protein
MLQNLRPLTTQTVASLLLRLVPNVVFSGAAKRAEFRKSAALCWAILACRLLKRSDSRQTTVCFVGSEKYIVWADRLALATGLDLR